MSDGPFINDNLDSPWSLQSLRFSVKHVRLLLQLREGVRPTAHWYTNLQGEDSQHVFQATTIDGDLPHGVCFALERLYHHMEDAYDLFVVGLHEGHGDYMFVDLYGSSDRFSNESIRLASRPRPLEPAVRYKVSVDDLNGLDINLYILQGIRLHALAAIPARVPDQDSSLFKLNHDPCDFNGCWHEMIDVVVDSKRFHVPRGLAIARLPYFATLVTSNFHATSPSQIELQVPNATPESFESLLGIMVGGQAYYEHWWWTHGWPEALDLVIIADFLGYQVLVESLECLLVAALQVESDLRHACDILQRTEAGFPRLPSLMQACLCNASHQVLASLCRQCNGMHLEKLLRQHAIVDWKSMKHMMANHVATFAPLLGHSDMVDGCEDAGSSGSGPRQDTFNTMHFHLSQAQERAAKAESEVAQLKEQLLAANCEWPNGAGNSSGSYHGNYQLNSSSEPCSKAGGPAKSPDGMNRWRVSRKLTSLMCCQKRAPMCSETPKQKCIQGSSSPARPPSSL